MKTFKALLKDTRQDNDGMNFELGTIYSVLYEKNSSNNTFDFTNNLFTIPTWYEFNNYDIFEVEVLGNIVYNRTEDRYFTDRIKLVKKLSDKEIKDWYETNTLECLKTANYYTKYNMIKLGIEPALDILVKDPDSSIRFNVAKYGRDKDLDILVNDVDPKVRLEVAKHKRKQDLFLLGKDYDHRVVTGARKFSINI